MKDLHFYKILKRTTGSLTRFAIGEVIARLCMLALYAFTTRKFGVAIFGILALAQTVSTYVTLFADQGYKLIGARLLARDRLLAPYLIRVINPRRAISAGFAAIAGLIYAAYGPMPSESRPLVAAFALAVIPASLALDWILWGTESYMMLSAWKALVAFITSGVAIAGMLLTRHPLWSISIGNFAAAIAGSIALWIYVSATFGKTSYAHDTVVRLQEVRTELRTSKVIGLGTASLLNLAFTNSDMLLLAAMTDATEVGRYGSATRLLFVIFSAYHILLNTLYPKFAMLQQNNLFKRYLLPILGTLSIVGGLCAILLAHFSVQLLAIVYGPNTHADGLLRILAFAFPLELGTALMGTMLASRGYESILLRCLVLAAALNVILNLIFIPRYHAIATSWSTVVSYCALWLLCTGSMIRLKPKQSPVAFVVEG